MVALAKTIHRFRGTRRLDPALHRLVQALIAPLDIRRLRQNELP